MKSTISPAAASVGCFGTYALTVAPTCCACGVCCACLVRDVLLEKQCDTSRACFSERELHARHQTHGHRSPAAEQRREKPDQREVPHADAAGGNGTLAVDMRPRTSIQNATPNVAQLMSIRPLARMMADTGNGGSGVVASASLPSQSAVRRQANTPIRASAASSAPPSNTGEAACGVANAMSTTPVPSTTACIANAEMAAALRRTPARSASTTSPATLHTLPGM